MAHKNDHRKPEQPLTNKDSALPPLSRRDLLKGAAAAGAAAAAAVTLKAAPATAGANRKVEDPRPWWVKRIDGPKYEINADYGPFDANNTAFSRFADYVGREKAAELNAQNREIILRSIRGNTPGNDLAARALVQGANTVRNSIAARTLYSWEPINARHPRQAYGVDRWQGSPDEAARMVNAAARHYGAGTVGIAHLDRRHLYRREGRRDVVFEQVAAPYQTESKRVIPESFKWVIVVVIPQSRQLNLRAPSAMGSAATGLGYSLMPFVAGSLAEFIRALGYHAIASGNDLGQSVPMAIDAGLGEFGRTGRLITPEYGMNVRLAKVLTDLPIAPDRPIDFGVLEFCRTCKRCAEECPGGALSMETEPGWQTLGEWNQGGKKVWPEDAARCLAVWRRLGTGCSICVRVCPYNKGNATIIHDLVKATSSTTAAFNGLFVRSDEFFGYGSERDQQAWWALHEPPFGYEPG